MTILVTGASGFVGSALVPLLAAEGHTGVATGRKPPINLPPGWLGLERAEVLSRKRGMEEVDCVIHLEVKQHVARLNATSIAAFEETNVEGTREWVGWAAANGINRFIYFSSIKAVAAQPGIHSETDLRLPDSPYGRSKAAGEQVVRDWVSASGERVATILRPAPVYGPGNQANLAAFVRQVLLGRRCFVGEGRTRKSLVGRRNLVAATAFLLSQDVRGCEIFNVSDSETVSVKELALLIAELGNGPVPRGIPRRFAKIAASFGDVCEILTGYDFPLSTARLRSLEEETVFPCDKLVAAGFQHPFTLRNGIAEMVDWAKAQCIYNYSAALLGKS
jgi:nucleoside-diphosphate-sugar epimerase